jgi:hypothetical protein
LSAGAPLWNGTAVASVFAIAFSTYSAMMRDDEPPKPKLGGLSFAALTKSARVFAGLAALTASPWLSSAAIATGRRSAVA